MANETTKKSLGFTRPLVDGLRQAAEVAEIFGLTLTHLVRGRRESGAIVRQMHEIGNRSLVFIAFTVGFLGMISVFQVATQAKQILPDLSVIGPSFIQMMIREFAPTICGLMVATRVGSGIAAEIGSMVVTEQVDALKMSNADPVNYLIVPRFIACAVMMVVLTIFACTVSIFAGMLMAVFGFELHPKTFLDFSLVGYGDVFSGLAKALAYGMAIPIISGHSGLNTKGGSEGVGWATTMAVVNSSFAVIVLDLAISVIAFFTVY